MEMQTLDDAMLFFIKVLRSAQASYWSLLELHARDKLSVRGVDFLHAQVVFRFWRLSDAVHTISTIELPTKTSWTLFPPALGKPH